MGQHLTDLSQLWQIKVLYNLPDEQLKSIQCLVGRVEDRGKWGLVDCSGPLAHAVFTEAD